MPDSTEPPTSSSQIPADSFATGATVPILWDPETRAVMRGQIIDTEGSFKIKLDDKLCFQSGKETDTLSHTSGANKVQREHLLQLLAGDQVAASTILRTLSKAHAEAYQQVTQWTKERSTKKGAQIAGWKACRSKLEETTRTALGFLARTIGTPKDVEITDRMITDCVDKLTGLRSALSIWDHEDTVNRFPDTPKLYEAIDKAFSKGMGSLQDPAKRASFMQESQRFFKPVHSWTSIYAPNASGESQSKASTTKNGDSHLPYKWTPSVILHPLPGVGGSLVPKHSTLDYPRVASKDQVDKPLGSLLAGQSHQQVTSKGTFSVIGNYIFPAFKDYAEHINACGKHIKENESTPEAVQLMTNLSGSSHCASQQIVSEIAECISAWKTEFDRCRTKLKKQVKNSKATQEHLDMLTLLRLRTMCKEWSAAGPCYDLAGNFEDGTLYPDLEWQETLKARAKLATCTAAEQEKQLKEHVSIWRTAAEQELTHNGNQSKMLSFLSLLETPCSLADLMDPKSQKRQATLSHPEAEDLKDQECMEADDPATNSNPGSVETTECQDLQNQDDPLSRNLPAFESVFCKDPSKMRQLKGMTFGNFNPQTGE